MLDALAPTVACFEEAGRRGFSVVYGVEKAAQAARAGAEATANMKPRFGRSSYLGDRALGHPDPGAVAVARVLEALAQAFGDQP
jgi:dihydroxyacetone kinase